MKDLEILATGSEFVKEGLRGIEPVMEEIIQNAQNEIQILAYLFTDSTSHMISLLGNAADKGVKITIVINRLQLQSASIRLKLDKLSKSYSNVRLVNFNDLNKQVHAKVIVIDRKLAVIGSANFSWSGMYKNYEIGVMIHDKHAWKLSKIIDRFSSMGSSASAGKEMTEVIW